MDLPRTCRRGLLLLALSLGACTCAADDAEPARIAQRVPSSAPPPPEGPAPSGQPLVAAALEQALPARVGDFERVGKPRFRASPVPNGGELASADQQYVRGGQRLSVQITDALHAPEARRFVEAVQGRSENSAEGTYQGTEIAGHRAIVQWNASSRQGQASLLVDDRFLVHLRLRSVDDPATVMAVAKALDVTALARAAREGVGATGAGSGKAAKGAAP